MRNDLFLNVFIAYSIFRMTAYFLRTPIFSVIIWIQFAHNEYQSRIGLHLTRRDVLTEHISGRPSHNGASYKWKP